MWDAVARILTDKQASTVLIFIVICMILLSAFAKLGIINIKTEHIKIGTATTNEREIIKRQLAFIDGAIRMFEVKIPRYAGYDKWMTKAISSFIYKEWVSWVLFNHIKDTSMYIGLKQTIIWNIIVSNYPSEVHSNEEFRQAVFEHVEENIKVLIKIRKEYQ